MATEPSSAEPAMDSTALYREDVFTDRRVGTIRVLLPVRPDGSPDASRKPAYVGEAQMLTAGGVLPLAFEIDASSLAEAVQKFSAGAKAAVERTIKEIQELRREAASSIIVPETMPGGLGGRGMPRGGGGLIQMP